MCYKMTRIIQGLSKMEEKRILFLFPNSHVCYVIIKSSFEQLVELFMENKTLEQNVEHTIHCKSLKFKTI